MSDYDRVCESVKGAAVDLALEITLQWKLKATAEPWFTFPERIDFDHLPELIASLADVALDRSTDPETRRRKIWAAARHGSDRRGHGFHEELIFREYDLLRRALWQYIRDHHGISQPCTNVILAIDSGISLAASASLRGYHRDAFEAAGRWPGAIEELLDRWPLPPEVKVDARSAPGRED